MAVELRVAREFDSTRIEALLGSHLRELDARELPGEDSVVHGVAEFYVQPAKRQRGIGRSAAFALWKRFPGPWQLEVNPANTTAHRFWRSCIEAIAKEAPRVSETRVRGSKWIQFDWSVD